MNPLVIFSIASTGLQMFGQYQEAKNQASLLQEEAGLLKMEANEIIARAQENRNLLFEEARKFQGTQVAKFAGSGGGLSASRMQLLMETANSAAEQATRDAREAQWSASQRIRTAESKERAAGQVREAGVLNLFGTAAAGGFQVARATGSGAAPAKTKG